MKHYALIPAKKKSVRCQRKNWRNFIDGDCLVDFTLKTIPKRLLERIIVSTDNVDYRFLTAPKSTLEIRNLRPVNLAFWISSL